MPRYKVIHGDCEKVLERLKENSIDALVTDPPYGMGEVYNLIGLLRAWLRFDSGMEYVSPTGFMREEWDKCVPPPHIWVETLRVLKPGGYGLVFASTRTQDLMGISLRIAGFLIVDEFKHIYSTGFPASRTKAPKGKALRLKPAHECIILVQKPIKAKSFRKQWDKTRTGYLNIDDCRIKGNRWPSNILLSHRRNCTEKKCSKYCPVLYLGQKAAYYPTFRYQLKAQKNEREMYLEEFPLVKRHRVNSGGMARDKKWAPIERRNPHKTVKPIELMRWLCKLVTPTNGIILDSFCGSGSTGCAALMEQFNFLGIEKDKQYVKIARRRIHCWGGI